MVATVTPSRPDAIGGLHRPYNAASEIDGDGLGGMILDAGLSKATLRAAVRGQHQVVCLDVPVTSTTKIGNRYPYGSFRASARKRLLP
jgi:hypothetical protein